MSRPAARRSPGRKSARPPRTRSSKSARYRKWLISPKTFRRPQPAFLNCRAQPGARTTNQKGNPMSENNTFLAVFLGSKTGAKMAAWNALPEAERRAKEKEGIAAWKAWVEKHQGAILEMG